PRLLHPLDCGNARQAAAKSSCEPYIRTTRAVPASAVDVTRRISPRGVNASVKELSGSWSSSAGPCQIPCHETTQPDCNFTGEPPVRPIFVGAPSVVHQPSTTPLSLKVWIAPDSVQSSALPCRLSRRGPAAPPLPVEVPTRPPSRCTYRRYRPPLLAATWPNPSHCRSSV